MNIFVSSMNQAMEYEQFVAKLFKQDTDDMEYLHAALGVCGEAGELADAIKKHVVYGKELDRKNIVEELGDLRFYMQAIMNKLDIHEDEVLGHNVAKLEERYKQLSYSNEAAIARADKKFNPNDYEDWKQVVSHIWYSGFAGGYVFSDEAPQFDTTLYPNKSSAVAALETYCKQLNNPTLGINEQILEPVQVPDNRRINRQN